MKVRVLKELPQGQEPGTILDFDENLVKALLLVGAVEVVVEPEPPKRPTYRRRDLKAERSEELTAAE